MCLIVNSLLAVTLAIAALSGIHTKHNRHTYKYTETAHGDRHKNLYLVNKEAKSKRPSFHDTQKTVLESRETALQCTQAASRNDTMSYSELSFTRALWIVH